MAQQRPRRSFEQPPQDEVARLIAQSAFHRDITRRFLGAVGIRSGMDVLIVGCGAGDDAFEAAELVGPTGRVTGIDPVAAKIDACRQRAEQLGAGNVRFQTSSIEALGGRSFDAAFGRYVLMHCSDPASVVRAASDRVAPGGVVGFYEVDLLGGCLTSPPAPLFDARMAQAVEAPRAYLPSPDAARCLVGIFVEAGLPMPDLLCERPTASRNPMPLCRWAAGYVGKALAYIEPDSPRLDLDRLAADLHADIRAAGSQVAIYDQWLAWSRKGALGYDAPKGERTRQ